MPGKRILIIGDSTNSKEGDAFVPYYERLIRHLASGSKVACVGLSINPGQTTDVSRQNASQSARLAEWVQQNPDATLPKTLDFTPPGFRVGDGVVNSPGLTNYAYLYATGIYDDADISPQGTENWIAGGDIRISYAVSGGRTANDWLSALKLVRLSDHGGSTSIGSWSFTNLTDETIAKTTDGLTRLDVTHTSPADHRVGLAVKPTGTGGDQASTIGDAIFISTCWVWDATEILDPDAYALDSISIGGWAVEDWANTHDSGDYAAYLDAMPYTPDTVIIWLGQNAGAGEWTGTVWTSAFDTNMETLIADVRAGFTAAGKDQPTIVLAAPPQMVDAYVATDRMGLLRDRIETLAADNDCAFLDLWTPPGNSLINIDSGYSHSLGVHPTAAGADFVGDYFWDELNAALSPPTVVNRTPADDATGVLPSQTISMQFSENMVVGSGTIELRKVSDDSVIDSIAAGDATINISDRTQVTLTGLNATGYTGAAYVYIPSGAFVGASTLVPFAGYTTNTDWNFTVGSSQALASRQDIVPMFRKFIG